MCYSLLDHLPCCIPATLEMVDLCKPVIYTNAVYCFGICNFPEVVAALVLTTAVISPHNSSEQRNLAIPSAVALYVVENVRQASVVKDVVILLAF
jgi:hypothetical protein